MKKKNFISLVMLMGLTVVLVACGGTKGTTTKKVSDKDIAKDDATTVLNYFYKGTSSNMKEVTGKNSDDFTDSIISESYDKKIKTMKDDGLALKYPDLDLDADPILHQWIKVRLETYQAVKKYKISSVKVTGKKATIKFKIDPLAGLSGTHNVEEVKDEALGDDLSMAASMTDDKEIKSVMNLLNFKVFSMLYGDHAYPYPLYGHEKTVTMTMTKKGDHFMIDSDTIWDLAENSEVNKYSLKKSMTEEENDVKAEMQNA